MTALLEVEGLEAGYGPAQILFAVSLLVQEGSVATLLGRNGMGKTTTIGAIMGIVKPRGGTIRFAGERIDHLPPYKIARRGLGLVPEGRQVFPTLSVRENLVATASPRGPWTLDRVLAFFPALVPRLGSPGGLLSGGEQQMLAIGRALATNPRLLIMDEATEGLARQIRAEIWRALARLKTEGVSILIVDKNLRALNQIADRHHLMENGAAVWSGTPAELEADPAQRKRLTI